MKDKRYAVLLLNLGGPSSLGDVRHFLRRLFMDPDIVKFPLPFLQSSFANLVSKLRAPSVEKNYALIGGASPILKITNMQAKGLYERLSEDISVRLYVGMRYSSPFIEDSLKEIIEYKPDCLIVLPLYPHYSVTTTGSSFNELDRAMKRLSFSLETIKISHWYDFPEYIGSVAKLIMSSLESYEEPDKVHLLFSAHGIPLSIVREGDPYDKHINASAEAIIKEISLPNPYYICYQSKVGPLKWLEPSTEKTIASISKMGRDEDILVIPISFVSDHYETNYEIDIEYADIAKELGIRSFRRVSSLNTESSFIDALYKLVVRKLRRQRLKYSS